MRLNISTKPQLASAGDRMRDLSDAALVLAGQMDRPARSHAEVEARIAAGERIATEIRRLVRG